METIQVIIEQKAGDINFNFEEMKQYLSERLEEYKTAIFTDESIKSAKAYTALLRKEQGAFKSRITEVKKIYMKPFDDFKEKADELVRLYDEPILFIDGQVKDYEKRRKEEKAKEIRKIYEELVPVGIKEYIPLEKIYNSKWENATYTKANVRKEISEVSASVEEAVKTINGMASDVGSKALAMYKQDLSLSNVVAYINNYERQKAEILLLEQERKRVEEEARIRREERERIVAEQQMAQQMEEAVEKAKEETAKEVFDSLTPEFSGATFVCAYRLMLTEDSKEKLEMYMDSVGIEWELE